MYGSLSVLSTLADGGYSIQGMGTIKENKINHNVLFLL